MNRPERPALGTGHTIRSIDDPRGGARVDLKVPRNVHARPLDLPRMVPIKDADFLRDDDDERGEDQ